jgi:lipopolysaccharide biosynthesis protein
MTLTEKSLCVFIHFEKTGYIPKYVEMYVNELSRQFNEVILVQNKREFNSVLPNFERNVSLQSVDNEGYDMGMFFKIFKTINHSDYKQIACINDSNILLKSLTPVISWSAKQNCDFWGLIDSYEKPWFSTHKNTYHLQSHFIVFNEKAIALLPEFFEKINVDSIMSQKDTKKLRQTVINEWEIGLTQYFVQKGLKPATYMSSKSFSKKYHLGKQKNVTMQFSPQLIKSGYPLLKKKIIFTRTWKEKLRLQPSWESLIIRFGEKDWEINSMIDDLIRMKKR